MLIPAFRIMSDFADSKLGCDFDQASGDEDICWADRYIG